MDQIFGWIATLAATEPTTIARFPAAVRALCWRA
jgi:hypothetical protein